MADSELNKKNNRSKNKAAGGGSRQWGDEDKLSRRTREAKARVEERKGDERWQHELKEMRETHDLREVDDDVEEASTLYEWHADEHEHRPKSPVWFAVLASALTITVSLLLFVYVNIFGAILTAFAGALIYYIAQQKPGMVRYRVMLDGVALNNVMYHWEDLESFNIIYEPDETKTVIIRSAKLFSPYIHMEIGEADPIKIRDILIEFLDEDQEIQEPMTDIVARRLGF